MSRFLQSPDFCLRKVFFCEESRCSTKSHDLFTKSNDFLWKIKIFWKNVFFFHMNPVIWKGLSWGGQLTQNWDAIFLGIGEGCNRVLWTEWVKEMSFKTYLKEKVALGPKLWPISHGDLAPSRDFLGFPLINERSFIMGNPSWEQGRRGKSVIPGLAGFQDGHITTRIWLHVTLKLTLKLTLGCLKMHHDPGTLGQF